MVAHTRAPDGVDHLRSLNQPQPIRVVAGSDGRPKAVYWRGRRFGVSAIQDQWRIDDEWWRVELSRMYFVLLLDGERIMSVFHDLIGGAWFFQQAGAPKATEQPVRVMIPKDVAAPKPVTNIPPTQLPVPGPVPMPAAAHLRLVETRPARETEAV